MKAVAMVNGTRIEISGKTQVIDTLIAELPLYEQIMRRELKNPPVTGGTFYPEPNTGLAFMAILENWKYTTKRKIEILVNEGIEKIPSIEGVVY